MKIPLSWLREFIDVDLPAQQIAKTLTMLGLEVDALHTTGARFSNIVVAKVVEVEKHPNADNLVVAKVFDGNETIQVVCGAPNCRPGIKTAFARVGAVIPDGESTFKIKKASLKGIESFGMLCSAKELEIGSEDDGIMEFDNHLTEGADVASLYADTVFEISLTPNLGHCLSIYGVARDLAAALELPLKDPAGALKLPAKPSAYTVEVENSTKCPRYTCCVIKGIKIAPSPDWMQQRLTACGLRPVNNVVDATNYILMELGQPLHAFDQDKLKGNTITVRSAKNGQSFQALDASLHILSDGDITINDGEGIIALGGIMGGEHSKVTDETTNIVLESAVFEPSSIRRSSRRLGLMSDSSYRFEKGIDWDYVNKALYQAAQLIQKIAGGHIEEGITDNYSGKKDPLKITCRLAKVRQLLGIPITTGEVESIFSRLGFQFQPDAQESYIVTVPSWRHDLKEEVDLIEDVARMYGYENIPRIQNGYTTSTIDDAPLYVFEKEVTNRLVAEGLQEFLTCDLISPQQITYAIDKTLPQDSFVKVLNPCSIEQSVLRPSFLPNLLQVVKYNIDHQTRDISGFEVGRVHFKEGEKYFDQSTVGIVLSGSRAPYNWQDKSQEVDFYDLKGIVENLLTSLRVTGYSIVPSTLTTLHPHRQAAVWIGENELGAFGEVHPDVLKFYDIDQRVYFAEFNIINLFQLRDPEPTCKPLSLYPSSERDWTITVDESLQAGKILDTAKSMPSRLLKEVTLLGIYQGEKLGPSKKNITLRFIYRDDNKTISQQAVDAEHDRLMNHVTAALSK